MKPLVLRAWVGAYLCQSLYLPVFAQGDPVVTPVAPQPKVEIQQPTNNNNAQALFQTFQTLQNQQNSLFNTPAVQLNPSITPLDQRSGLIQNSTKFSPFGISGIGFNNFGMPKINNSNLLANPDNNALARDVANYLRSTEPRINVQTTLLPKLNTLTTAQLISALAIALGVPENLIQNFFARVSPSAMENLRSNLLTLAINLKIGNVPPNIAQNAFMQITGMFNPNTVATSTPKLASPVQTATQSTTQAISSLKEFVGKTGQNTETTLIEVSNQMKATESGVKPGITASTTTTTSTSSTSSSTSSTSTTTSREAVDARKEKITELENKISTAAENKEKDSITSKFTSSVPTPGAVMSNPVAFAQVISSAINGTVGGSLNSVVSSVATAFGVAPSASAKAGATFPPGMPDPVALVNGALIQGTLASMKINPIVGQALIVKAALGHYNNSPALPALTKFLSTPNLPPELAQVVIVKFLDATAKPGDVPVRAVLAATPTSSASSSNGNMSELIKHLETVIDEALTRMGGANDAFSNILDSVNNAMKDTQNTMQKVQFKG
ncbi:MAG: hypothetical protein KIT34_03260 [Cyanobacteria bacterium TGS_CYA1]|nr:hypothetical protein [Cyanobacteria bacterium TGS_CYA1]